MKNYKKIKKLLVSVRQHSIQSHRNEKIACFRKVLKCVKHHSFVAIFQWDANSVELKMAFFDMFNSLKLWDEMNT